MRLLESLLAACAVFGVVSCGETAATGGSSLIGRTFAGQNRCDPKNHDRPFIIEWDATDQSSFQSLAASDVVVVHYSGCELRVLDGCTVDSLKGAFGSYKPVDWTIGQLESVDIHDTNELYSKLPLGAAAFAGRIQNGEKFHMEYYVSGTRSATREHLYRATLNTVEGCRGATHFVRAYNLGAFAIASASELETKANGSYFGFGAGGLHASKTRVEKNGGVLASCSNDDVHASDSCKVPIRLTLREISDGPDPLSASREAPETDTAASLAGRLQIGAEQTQAAAGHMNAAKEKQVAGDGLGCLAELDLHDRADLNPNAASTSAKSGELARMRVRCLMLAGQCDAGRVFGRKVLDAAGDGDIDQVLDASIGRFCRTRNASTRDQYLHAAYVLEDGAVSKQHAPDECHEAYETIMRMRSQGLPTPDFDLPEWVTHKAASCMARGGDCGGGYRLFEQVMSQAAERCTILQPYLTRACPPDATLTDVQLRKAYTDQLALMHIVCTGF